MTDFADLSAVKSAIVEQLLPEYGFSTSAEIHLLGVSENANFAVSDPVSNRSSVVRVHRQGYHGERAIVSELNWMSAIRAETELLIPDPIPTISGQWVVPLDVEGSVQRKAVMFSRAPGQNLTIDDATPELYARLGAICAELHAHSMRWQRPDGFYRYQWDLDAMIGPRARFGHWGDHPGLDDASRSVLAQVAATVQSRVAEFSVQPDAIGLAHTDLHVLNLMTDGTDLWAIDFDDCGISWYMHDIAPALASFEPGPLVDELLAAWVQGYETRRRLSDAEREILKDFVMLRRLLVLGWSATHPGARVPGIENDLVAVTVEAARDYTSTPAR